MNLMDSQGNVSIEYMLLLGILFLMSLMIAYHINDANELNIAMGAARSGASEGSTINNLAIYPKNSFDTYENEKEELLTTRCLKIVKIEFQNQGYNPNYKRNKIQLKVYATGPLIKPVERNSIGDRINYNVRKTICKSFQTENLSNIFYNPAFSDKYVFTTADVRWV